MSSLTWLDYSDSERKRALQVIELLGRPETRDELGLGAIRDAFAEALFPGMSTLSTYVHLIDQGLGDADFLDEAITVNAA